MGWLTDLSNVAVGAIERDREITKEDLAIRAENLRANKEILTKQKEYKWAKELEDYESEKVKFDQLEAANAIFKIDNNDYNYAISALPLVTPNWDKLTTEMKNEQIFNFKGETFDYTLEGTRDEINEKAAMEMTALNDIVAKQIKDAKGDSFLIKQILRKKESVEKNILESMESKVDAAETIKLTERKLNPENVGLAVQVGSGQTDDDRAWKKFQKSELGKTWMTKFLAEQKDAKWNAIVFKDSFNKILSFMDIKNLTVEGNFKTDGYDIKIEGLNDASRQIFESYKGIYEEVWKSIDAKNLWANGVEVQDLAKYVNINYVSDTIYKVAESRWYSKTMTVKGKERNFLGILPLNIVPLNLENVTYGQINNVDIVDIETGHKLDTLNLTAPNKVFSLLYERFVDAKASEMKGGASLNNLNAIQTIMSKGANQQLIKEFKIYIGQNFEKVAEELGITDITQTKKFSLQDNNGEISLFNSTSGKAVSLSQLKEEGKLEAVLEKYPWIKDDPKYIAWLKTQEQ